VERQASKKAIVVPIDRGRRRRARIAPPPHANQREKRSRPLGLAVAGLVAITVLALAVHIATNRLAATGQVAAAMGTGLGFLVVILAVGALLYLRRADFGWRARPRVGPRGRGPRSGAFGS